MAPARSSPTPSRTRRAAISLTSDHPRRSTTSDRIEQVHLRSADAQARHQRFGDGKSTLVLGGTFVDLPLVDRDGQLPAQCAAFRSRRGLFGLVPARAGGPLADKQCATCSTAGDRPRRAGRRARRARTSSRARPCCKAGSKAAPIRSPRPGPRQPDARAPGAAAAEARTAVRREREPKLAHRAARRPRRRHPVRAAGGATGGRSASSSSRAGKGVAGRPQAGRPGGAVELAGMVRPQLPLRRRAALLEGSRRVDGFRRATRSIAAQRAALLAEAGRLIDERRAVPADRRAGALVAGRRRHAGLCREQLRPPPVERPERQARPRKRQ